MSDQRNRFDRMADGCAAVVAHWSFFAACVLICLLWAPTLLLMNVDTSQLIISTITTIITFLLVALLHNTQHRFEDAVNARLQEVLDKLDGAGDPVKDEGQK